MRKKIVAGNWKMNTDWEEAISLLDELSAGAEDFPTDVRVIVAPPALYLSGFQRRAEKPIRLAAQNCSAHNYGAHTGEVAAQMLMSVGVKNVILGHSERRANHGETDQIVAAKVRHALEEGLSVIFCCGENLSERESGNHFEVVKQQVKAGLADVSNNKIHHVTIAYEPVWAIGTGRTASADQAQEMHKEIRTLIAEIYDEAIADNMSILYGGSCKPNNAKELFANPDVDGGLIGGAALKAEDFIGIIKSFD